MKYNNLTIGFGIAFGLGMLPLAYLNLALGIVLAFAGKGDFSIMIYVFAVLGVLTIISSCFAKKCIWVPRVINTLAVLTLLGTVIYLAVCEVLLANILLAVPYVFVLIIGLLSAVFAWLAKQIKKQSVTTENNV